MADKGKQDLAPGEFEPHTVDDAAEGIFDLMSDHGLDAFDLKKDEEEPDADESDADESEDEDASPAKDDADDEPEEDDAAEDDAEESDAEEDADEADDEPSDDSDSPTHKVKVDGEDVEVTLDEALAGYQRQSDYTRKTQELATHRRELESSRETFEDQRGQYAEALETLEAVLEAQLPQEPDWDALRKENPNQFAATYAAWDQYQKKIEATKAERTRVFNEATAEATEREDAAVAAEQVALLEKVPEWKDQEVVLADQTKMVEFASSYGFTPEEVGGLVDHRVVVLLRDAMLGQQIQQKGKAARTKAKTSKTLKPGSPSRKSRSSKKRGEAYNDARKRLQESGRVDDAAAALFETLNE